MIKKTKFKSPRILLYDIEPYYNINYDTQTGNLRILSKAWGKKRILKQHINNTGYLCVKMNNTNYNIHAIIREICFGIKKHGYTINHKDGNKLNNKLCNLEYITIAENIKHAVKLGLHVSSDPKRSGRYKDGRAIKSKLKEYKYNWLKNKNDKKKNK